jgi:hypothetical protein
MSTEHLDPTDLDALVEAIREELNARTGGVFKEGRVCLGLLSKNKSSTFPRVEFVEIGGKLEDDTTQNTGGTQGDIAVDAKEFEVVIWGKDTRDCLAIFFELKRAMRTVFDGQECEVTDYSWDEPGNNDRGRKLICPSVIVRTHVPAATKYDWTLTQVEHFETTVASTDTSVDIEQDATL